MNTQRATSTTTTTKKPFHIKLYFHLALRYSGHAMFPFSLLFRSEQMLHLYQQTILLVLGGIRWDTWDSYLAEAPTYTTVPHALPPQPCYHRGSVRGVGPQKRTFLKQTNKENLSDMAEQRVEPNQCTQCQYFFVQGKRICTGCGTSFVCPKCLSVVNPTYNFCDGTATTGLPCGHRMDPTTPLTHILRKITGIPFDKIQTYVAEIVKNTEITQARRAVMQQTGPVTADEAGVMLTYCTIRNGKVSMKCKSMLVELRWCHPDSATLNGACLKLRSGLRTVLGGKTANLSTAEARVKIANDIRTYLGPDSPYTVNVNKLMLDRQSAIKWMLVHKYISPAKRQRAGPLDFACNSDDERMDDGESDDSTSDSSESSDEDAPVRRK
mmetsp:Transcript_6198/g.6865  ORF Transcript_6198/g.6865 Transcript_6198/m.6865 type:complete len:382 (-) Transcript_6198:1088-2233(-)